MYKLLVIEINRAINKQKIMTETQNIDALIMLNCNINKTNKINPIS